jgi:hypothetical protein
MALVAGTASHSTPPGTGQAGALYAAGVSAGVFTANASAAAFATVLAQWIVSMLTTDAVVNSLGLIAPPGTAGGPVTGSSTIT